MRTTTTLVAVGAIVLAMPTSAQAIPQPAIQVPLAGHLTVGAQMRAAHRALSHERLTRKAVPLARRVAHARERGFSARRYRRAVRHDSPARLAARVRTMRRELRRALRRAAEPAVSPTLAAIAACESGGNPGTSTGNGFYGKYQFTQETWAGVGGAGNPAAAGEAEQDLRAAMLYAREGASPWPVCGR